MTKSFQNEVYSLWKEFAPVGANSFLKELALIGKRWQEMKMAELLFLKGHSFTFGIKVIIFVFAGA